MTERSQEEGHQHHDLIPFPGAVVSCINVIITTLVPGEVVEADTPVPVHVRIVYVIITTVFTGHLLGTLYIS